MTVLIAAAGGFLLAVLWMDLTFDVLVLRHRKRGELPEDVLASIAAYYRRVTTTSWPMGLLIGVVMGLGLIGIFVQLMRGDVPRSISLVSLLLIAPPIGLASSRVLPNAVRLGARTDSVEQQSRMARGICRDHLFCLAAVLAFLALRLWAAA